MPYKSLRVVVTDWGNRRGRIFFPTGFAPSGVVEPAPARARATRRARAQEATLSRTLVMINAKRRPALSNTNSNSLCINMSREPTT